MSEAEQENSWYVLASPGYVERRTARLDQLPADWARVRFLFCGLCGSDLSKFEGRSRGTLPLAIGHEFVAQVVAVGEHVSAVDVGSYVTSDLNFRCGACSQCEAERSHLCERGQEGHFTNRGFARFADLHASYLQPLTRRPGPAGALAEPLSCALHAVRRGAPKPGDRVLVIGAGGIGLCTAYALAHGSPPVEFEITDPNIERLGRIDRAIGTTGRAVTKSADCYDVVFDVSGSESGLRAACDVVRPGGRLCSVSHLAGYTDGAFLLEKLTPLDVTFTISYLNGERENLSHAVHLIESCWTDAWEACIEVRPIEELQATFEQRRTSSACKTILRLDSQG